MGVQFGAFSWEEGRHTRIEIPEADSFHLHMANGWYLFRLLYLAFGDDFDDQAGPGCTTIPRARRAVISARARFDRLILGVQGDPDPEVVRDRLERFAKFVEVASDLGATHVRWG